MNFIIKDEIYGDGKDSKCTDSYDILRDYALGAPESDNMSTFIQRDDKRIEISGIKNYMDAVTPNESFAIVPYISNNDNGLIDNHLGYSYNIYSDIYSVNGLREEKLVKSCLDMAYVDNIKNPDTVCNIISDRIALTKDNVHVLLDNRIAFLSDYASCFIVQEIVGLVKERIATFTNDEKVIMDIIDCIIQNPNGYQGDLTSIISRMIERTIKNATQIYVINGIKNYEDTKFIKDKENLAVEDLTIKTGISFILNCTTKNLSVALTKYCPFDAANILAVINEDLYPLYSKLIPTQINTIYYQIMSEFFAFYSKFSTNLLVSEEEFYENYKKNCVEPQPIPEGKVSEVSQEDFLNTVREACGIEEPKKKKGRKKKVKIMEF